MHMTQKRANVLYAVIQALYFANMAIILNYASAYLLAHGYSNTQIGLLLGISTVVTVVLQLALAELIVRSGLPLGRTMSVMFVVLAVLAFMLLVLPLRGAAFALAIGGVYVIENTLQPSINSLYRGYKSQGIDINFALSRGIGSGAFSFTTLVVGQFLSRVEPKYLPVFYMLPSIALAVLLVIFHAPNVEAPRTQAGKTNLLKDYPYFTLFLVGVALLASSHSFSETFLLQILTRIGGNVSHVGIALAISSITELPAMLAYRWLFKKFGNRRLMLFAIWMWTLKSALIFLAPTVCVVYAAELLQLVSYAIYVATSAKHIAHAIPAGEFLRGQALAGSAFTVGGLIATLLGGRLIDAIGLRWAMLVIQSLSLCGAVIFTVSVIWSLKAIPQGQSFKEDELPEMDVRFIPKP